MCTLVDYCSWAEYPVMHEKGKSVMCLWLSLHLYIIIDTDTSVVRLLVSHVSTVIYYYTVEIL